MDSSDTLISICTTSPLLQKPESPPADQQYFLRSTVTGSFITMRGRENVIFTCTTSLQKKETKITTNETANGTHTTYGTLAIYGDRIMWLDWPSAEDLQPDGDLNFHIYMYDLSTSNGTRISISRDFIYYLAVYDNRIVWSSDNRTSDNNSTVDIYMCTVSGEDMGSNDEQQSQIEKK